MLGSVWRGVKKPGSLRWLSRPSLATVGNDASGRALHLQPAGREQSVGRSRSLVLATSPGGGNTGASLTMRQWHFVSGSPQDRHPGPERRALRRNFQDWLTRCPGSLMVDAERVHLDQVLPDLFGYHLVQVGRLAGSNLLSKSRILDRVLIEVDGDSSPARYPVVHGDASALPIESDGVDVVVMPHVLEFEPEPHEAVREASRVLVPEGHLIVTGFNPWSLLGLWRLALRSRATGPWHGRFISPSRLKDWLALLGFDLLEFASHFRRPPLGNPHLLDRFAFLERGTVPLSFAVGATYVALARKRVTTLTLVRPRWRPRRRLAAVGLAGPSARAVQDPLCRG